MDPISAAIIAAVKLGVADGIKDVGKEAVLDAYNGLKNWIVKKAGKDAKVTTAIAEVEQSPDSKARQMVLAEEMGMAKIAEESDFLTLANKLIEALKETDAGRQAVAKFQVDARGARVGVIGDHAKVDGGMHFGGKKP
jgi:hypothetical protein